MNAIRLLPLTFLLLGTGSACASDFGRGREMFHRLDTNGDRALQFSEIMAGRAALFDRIDANSDGSLNAEELRAATEKARSLHQGAALSAADAASQLALMEKNGAGGISRAQFSNAIPDRLRRADVNGDEMLSLGELRSLRRQ